MICDVCEWSALTTISVSGCVRWNSWAMPMASSMPISSPIWPQASEAWSRLSIEAPSTCSTKPFVVALQQRDRLVGHLGQRRLVAAVGRLALRGRRTGARVGRDQRLVLGRHVRVVEQAEQPLAGRQRRDGVQLGLGRDVLVALVLDRVVDDVLGPTGRQRLRVAGPAATEHHVELVVGLLLGDRAEPARGLGLRRARAARVVRALAAALGDVGGRAGRRRVRDLRGGDVARRETALAWRSPCRSRSWCPGRSRRSSGPGRGARRAS